MPRHFPALIFAAALALPLWSAPALAQSADPELRPRDRSDRMEEARARREDRSAYGLGFERRQIREGSAADAYRSERSESLRQAEACVRAAQTPQALRECEAQERERLRQTFSRLRESSPAASGERAFARPAPDSFSDRRRLRERARP